LTPTMAWGLTVGGAWAIVVIGRDSFVLGWTGVKGSAIPIHAGLTSLASARFFRL
jgi:hypothetical protein